VPGDIDKTAHDQIPKKIVEIAPGDYPPLI
jgi:hypothetical protein